MFKQSLTIDVGRPVTPNPADIVVLRSVARNEMGAVSAIQYLRIVHPMGLREAKDIVDYVRDNADKFLRLTDQR